MASGSASHTQEQFIRLARLAWDLRSLQVATAVVLPPGDLPVLDILQTPDRPLQATMIHRAHSRVFAWRPSWSRCWRPDRSAGTRRESGHKCQIGGECMKVQETAKLRAGRWPQCAADRDLSGLGQATFDGQAVSVSAARAWANDLLARHVGDEVRESAVLLLSELVTNAVVHSNSGRRPGGQVTVFLAAGDGAAYCEVIDDGSATSVPTVQDLSEEDAGGRGLWMVNAIADAWGFHHDDEVGNAVWFRMGDGPAAVSCLNACTGS